MTVNYTRELYNTLGAIYGNRVHLAAICAMVNDVEYDRWGVKIDITLIDGVRIVGRLSKKARKFNGTATKKGEYVPCKKYRSFRAVA